ncbi:MAG: CoA transferase, partial [Dehalococcoidia bacterium]|nr:CoA transferase [Dehalococcoidia bacterium]
AKVAERDRWGLFEHLGLLRCVCGVVLDMQDLATNPHLHDRGLPVSLTEADATFDVPGAPYKLSRTPWAKRLMPPRLGEHTQQVVADWLGEGAQ